MHYKKIKKILTGVVHEIPGFLEALEAWSGEHAVPRALTMQFVLMLDELLTNIALHAYQQQGGPVEVTVEVLEPVGLRAVIADQGPAFDPTRRPPVDTSAGIEDRAIGGLGVHFVHQLADVFSYERQGAFNVVTLVKMAA